MSTIRKTSNYGPRTHPVTGEKGKMHHGIDYGSPVGTPIYANQPLTVTRAAPSSQTGGYGNLVVAKDSAGNDHYFAHLDSINVKPGQTIVPGTKLGNTGNTGRSTGPHLHYEVRSNGKSVNPESINPATGKPYTHTAGFSPGTTFAGGQAGPIDPNFKPTTPDNTADTSAPGADPSDRKSVV